jgi:hypothetical protein
MAENAKAGQNKSFSLIHQFSAASAFSAVKQLKISPIFNQKCSTLKPKIGKLKIFFTPFLTTS